MFIIRLDSSDVRSELENLRRVVARPRRVLVASADAVAAKLREHFRRKDQTPNRLGGRRTHFWNRAVRIKTVRGKVTDSSAEVVIASPEFAQKLYGGRITAKQSKYLTIPVHPDAHGRRASITENALGIKLIFIKRGAGGILARRLADKKLEVYYVLKKSVYQEPDPDALPPGDELESAATEGAANFVRTIIVEEQAK